MRQNGLQRRSTRGALPTRLNEANLSPWAARGIAKRQNFLDQANFDRLYAAADRLSRMLSGLKNSLLDS